MKIFEHELRPKVEQTPKDVILMSDGFSCKTQIEQGTDREALHLAQVLQMALREGPHGPSGDYPERGYMKLETAQSGLPGIAVAATAAGLLLGGGLLYWNSRRR
jgi:hypothetical protein